MSLYFILDTAKHFTFSCILIGLLNNSWIHFTYSPYWQLPPLTSLHCPSRSVPHHSQIFWVIYLLSHRPGSINECRWHHSGSHPFPVSLLHGEWSLFGTCCSPWLSATPATLAWMQWVLGPRCQLCSWASHTLLLLFWNAPVSGFWPSFKAECNYIFLSPHPPC